MTFSLDQIMGWVVAYLWVLIRVGAAFMIAPVFGARSVPARLRALLALAITLVIVPVAPPAPAVDPLSIAGLLLVAQQVVIGLVIGFALNLIITMFVFAGEAIALSMGLGFAQTVDPQNGVNVPLVGQFLTIVATLLFISLDGPALMIKLLADSFVSMPVAPVGLDPESFRRLADFGQAIFTNGILVALPVVTTLLMVNIAMGVITRASPQLNIFSVGFPATLMIGFFLLLVTSPTWLPNMERFLQQVLTLISNLLGISGG